MFLYIDGEKFRITKTGYVDTNFEVVSLQVEGLGNLQVAKDADTMNQYVRSYYKNLAEDDTREFIELFGYDQIGTWLVYGGFNDWLEGIRARDEYQTVCDISVFTPRFKEVDRERYDDGDDSYVDKITRFWEDEIGFVPTVGYHR